MLFIPADITSISLFCLLAFFTFLIINYSFLKFSIPKRWPFYYLIFILIISAITIKGILRDHIIPGIPLLILGHILFVFAFLRSQSANILSKKLTLKQLIGFQSFRFPLELILHHWAINKTIPMTMTWTGQNLDIIAGVISLLSIPWLNKNIKLAKIINLIGILLLMNVLRVVIYSSPFPFSWKLEYPLQLALYFPYVLILPIFVMPALIAHILTLKKLKKNNI